LEFYTKKKKKETPNWLLYYSSGAVAKREGFWMAVKREK